MTDYSDYVHCCEVFRSSILSNEKPYLFKCIQCQDIFQLEAFLTHFEQNLCELREITIKEEVIDDGCLSGCYEMAKNEGINSNSIDEIKVNQVGSLNKASLVFKTDEDLSNAVKTDHVRYEIGLSDAEVDAEEQEFETDVSLEDDIDFDDDKYDSEDTNVSDETEYLVKRNKGNEEETISNFIENHDNVMALIEAYKAQTPLWNRSTSFLDKEERQKYLEIVTKELNQKRNLHLHWKQVSTLFRHLLRKYRNDLKQFKDSQKEKSTYRTLWFCKHMEFLQPFMENKNANGQAQKSHLVKVDLVALDPHLPSLLQEQIVQIVKIYENLPHLWNTRLIEHRCKNKRRECEMEMVKRIEATLGYEINRQTLNKYLKNMHLYFLQEKRKRLNDEHLENSELYQHLVFLLDHVGPFRCSQCDFENPSIYNYKVHLSQHDGSKPFKCSQCGKEFKQIRSYDIHVRHHLEDYKNICQECGRKFLAPYHLRRHTLRIHTNVRDCICKTCGKAFKTTDNLRTHEVIHSDIRKYVCTICSKSFKLGTNLAKHMRTHGRNLSDDKTMTSEDKMADCTCKTCGKTFKTKQHLRNHEVTHSDVRKYVCTICSKSFKLGFTLTQHMRIHGRNLSDDKTTTSDDKMTDTEIIVKDNLNEIL